MEFSQQQNLRILSVLLFLVVITQAVYTAMFMLANDLPRQWLWGLEALILSLIHI